jgi:hypothetical protein
LKCSKNLNGRKRNEMRENMTKDKIQGFLKLSCDNQTEAIILSGAICEDAQQAGVDPEKLVFTKQIVAENIGISEKRAKELIDDMEQNGLIEKLKDGIYHLIAY